MKSKVFAFIQKWKMIEEGDRVILGVSGGADSVCLLTLLLEYQRQCNFLPAVVHVNHGLREEAGGEAKFVRLLCEKAGIPFRLYEYPVSVIARERKLSLEEAGRMVRYEAFDMFMREWGATKIALAHHQNDQAETVLFNLARGSALTGLGGIKPVREGIIRPLLCIKREEIEHYLEDGNISFLTDASNLSFAHTRNRIRHQIVPLLEEGVNAQAIRHIAQAAEEICEAQKYMQSHAEKLFQLHAVLTDGCCLLSAKLFDEEDILIPYVVRLCIKHLGSGLKDITREHIRMVEGLALQSVGKQVNLPNQIKAVRRYEGVELQYIDRNKNEEVQKAQPHVEWTIFLKEKKIICQKKYTKCFDYDKIKNGFQIRTRRPGDYLTVNEAGGTKKLKDYFIDCKIPREKRKDILLAADGAHIIWVVGYRISEYYKVTKETKTILMMEAEGGGIHE